MNARAEQCRQAEEHNGPETLLLGSKGTPFEIEAVSVEFACGSQVGLFSTGEQIMCFNFETHPSREFAA